MKAEDETIIIDGLEFRLTCFACPEQYDVYRGAKQVGYVRLRGGYFRVDFRECGGEMLLEQTFEDDWKGCFDDDNERSYWLNGAAVVLLDALTGESSIPA
jgi:hypothetical protein